jgi:hypothetical protein
MCRSSPCGTWAWGRKLGAGRENRGGPGTSNAAASQQPTAGGGLGSHCVHAATPRMRRGRDALCLRGLPALPMSYDANWHSVLLMAPCLHAFGPDCGKSKSACHTGSKAAAGAVQQEPSTPAPRASVPLASRSKTSASFVDICGASTPSILETVRTAARACVGHVGVQMAAKANLAERRHGKPGTKSGRG